MKRILTFGIAFGLATLAQATSITLPNLGSLNGYFAYSLGVRLGVPAGKQLSSVTIDFHNIQLTSAPKGYLYFDILNINALGTRSYWDGDRFGDFFRPAINDGQGVALGVKEFTRWNQTLSWSYTLDSTELAALNSLNTGGLLSIGLDPDCYFNWERGSCTIDYKTCSKSVPDSGATASLLGLSLLGLIAVCRRGGL